MEKNKIKMQKNDFTIPYTHFGGVGNILHFAHANAYPPDCYLQLLKPLQAHFQVVGMHQRPLWEGSNPKKLKNWSQLADDLILFFEQQGIQKAIGMGHSLGGVVSILAAIKRPDLFSKLILIDPVVFSSKGNWFFNILPISLKKKFMPIAKIAAKRRDLWENKEDVYTSFRKKRVFRRFSDSVLLDFVNASTTETGDNKQVRLTFPKAWETQIYTTAPNVFPDLKKLTIPILAIKGEKSNVITSAIWKEWKDAQPHNQFLELPDSGHLVPMEHPQKLADWILGQLLSKR